MSETPTLNPVRDSGKEIDSALAVSPPRPARRPRLALLDGLRLLAAVSVMAHHYTGANDAWDASAKELFPILHPFTQYGWIGVEVFFLISGFVICMTAWNKGLGDFFSSRVTRLYPAYWVALTLSVIVITIWPTVRSTSSWTDVAVNYTMLQQGFGIPNVDGVYWTLFAELKFYLAFAIVVAMGVTFRRCVLFCVFWTLASMLAWQLSNDVLWSWVMPYYAPYFTGGIGLYLIYRFGLSAVPVGIVGVSFVLAEYSVKQRVGNLEPVVTNVDHPIAAWPAQLIIAGTFLFMLLLALGKFNRIQWRWLTTAGILTYPVYLLHQAIGLTVLHGLKDQLPALPLALGVMAMMLVFAWLVHRFAERPLARVLGRAMDRGIADLRQHSTR
ncbi:putative acyltransferase [Actinoplanes missouriensis 431]|uniref:Putative acyltransferase n=1 Tax=Actinoplanes missouriensis (strain ATCC 14538 / DSM 43046 / CBS 188.64 / JCM 3121 / NBRC 102363 / NCIMB 12654 / NRRL B-3342 / UNCC 431) TaxID=512565 RepID=I0HIW3_ACTM4|nr:acyltransferase [Actinoplanes missouriensis]BAL92950.1 putative acyltransferase [Actinoplanes missouriensis 431]